MRTPPLTPRSSRLRRRNQRPRHPRLRDLEALEPRQLLATFQVTHTGDSGLGSLRQAILDANILPGPDFIRFAIPASTAPNLDAPVPGFDPETQTWRIALASPLPEITDQVTIDAYTQAHFPVAYRYPAQVKQSILVDASATGGTFTISVVAPVPGHPVRTTAPISYNATALEVFSRLNDIVGAGNVITTGGDANVAPIYVSFLGEYINQNLGVPDIVVDGSGLAGGGVSVTKSGDPPEEITSQAAKDFSALNRNNAVIRVILDGSGINRLNDPSPIGFEINRSHTILRGFAIEGFDVGVAIGDPLGVPMNAEGVLIQGNAIGRYALYPVDPFTGQTPTGTVAAFGGVGNAAQGVLINATNATIGGTAPQDANVIARNGAEGISILVGAQGNQVVGNQIGVVGPTLSGYYTAPGNGSDGIRIASDLNAIGGSAPGAGNVISANHGHGVHLTGATATRNRVEGNYIGVAPGGGFRFGSGDPGNRLDGVRIDGGSQNTIGGTGAVGRNVISANDAAGVRILGASATSNLLRNNIIGLTSDGASALGNSGPGVLILTPGNTLEGRNIISANLRGVEIQGAAASGNTIRDNFIGTDLTGAIDLGNALEGVRITGAANNRVLGDGAGSQLITGNDVGLAIVGPGATGNVVSGNDIGLDASGSIPIGNSKEGVRLENAAANQIGGTTAAAANRIVGNHWGIVLTGADTTGNTVQGNTIRGSERAGVRVEGNASDNTLGGFANTITDNRGAGVEVASGTGNAILSNAIYANVGLGIDLGADGLPSINDPLDADTGPNNLQNRPLLQQATVEGNSTRLLGTLSAQPNTLYLLEFFANDSPTSEAEGQTRLGSLTLRTDAAGEAIIDTILPRAVALGLALTATATSPGNDTSEFSDAVAAVPGILGQLVVTTTQDAGAGSLRQAILLANMQAGPDTITFAIPGDGLQTILPLSPLPTITDTLTINGFSQGGQPNTGLWPIPPNIESTFTLAPVIEIRGSLAGGGANGLVFQPQPNGTTVGSLVIGVIVSQFDGAGIVLADTSSQALQQAGTNVSASIIQNNGQEGIRITSPNNLVGGTRTFLEHRVSDQIVIRGNRVGVSIVGAAATGNRIEGAVITDNLGAGVRIAASNNTLGDGVKESSLNVIGGNQVGVWIAPASPGGEMPRGNEVLTNWIGLAVDGRSAAPNREDGVRIEDARGNRIGAGALGTTSNVIAGNAWSGIVVSGLGSTANRIQNNAIGYFEPNRIPITVGNLDGVRIEAPANQVTGNVVSANRRHGVVVAGAIAGGNVIRGNRVGTDVDGTRDFGNFGDGIRIEDAADVVVGGTAPGQGNLVSGNAWGITIAGPSATGNRVEGNLIGTAADGRTDLGNAIDGVRILDAPRNTIGGSVAGAGNVIGGNDRGVRIEGPTAIGNRVLGNAIGVDATGTIAVGNELDGVYLNGGASDNVIGGTEPLSGNRIAYNLDNGIRADSGTGNAFRTNAIWSNGLLGIDLLGVANTNPQVPVLTAVVANGSWLSVQGTVSGLPATTYIIEIFAGTAADPSGFGEGERYLTWATAHTDAAGNGAFAIDFETDLTPGMFLSATATDPDGNTSEFSAVATAGTASIQFVASSIQVNEDAGTATVTVTRTGIINATASVAYRTENGNATAGPDYGAVAGTLTFAPGEVNKSFTVPIVNDNVIEGDETFQVVLSDPTGAARLGPQATATVTIVDDDFHPVSFASASYVVNESGAVTIVVRRGGPTTAAAQVSYTLVGGTATPGVDYVATSGVLTFAPGQNRVNLVVQTLDDLLIESDETFQVVLSNPQGLSLISPSSATVTIRDNDQPGVVQLVTASLQVREDNGAVWVVVTRTGGAAGQITVPYATFPGTATPGEDYTPVSGSLVFAPGETIKAFVVPILDDLRVEGPEAFSVAIGQPTGGATLGTQRTATVTILDNDVDVTPPRVVGVEPIVQNSRIVGLTVTFSEPLDPIRARDPYNYDAQFLSAGRDGRFGTVDDLATPIQSISYQPGSTQVVLVPARPLPLTMRHRLQINRFFGPIAGSGVADVAGNLLDGNGNGLPGGAYTAEFGAPIVRRRVRWR